MAGSDLYFSFGAQTDSLEAAIARTKVEISNLGRSASAMAREIAKSGQDMSSALGVSLKETTAKQSFYIADLKVLKEKQAEAAQSATAAAQAIRGFGEAARTASVNLKDATSAAGAMMAALGGGQKGGSVGLGVGTGIRAAGDAARASVVDMKEAAAQANAMRSALGMTSAAATVEAVEVAAVGAEVATLARSHRANSMQMMEGAHVVRALSDSMLAGIDPIRAVAMEGGRIAQIFAMGGPLSMGVLGIGAAFVAAAGGIGYFVYQAMAAREIANTLRNSLAFSGRGGMSDSDVTGVSAQLNSMRGLLSGLGKDEAQQIARELSKIPNLTGEMARTVLSDMQPLADVMGVKLPDAFKILAEGIRTPEGAAKALTDAFGPITAAQEAEIRAAASSLDPHKMQAAFLTLIAEGLDRTNRKRLEDIDAQIAQRKAQMALNEQMAAATGVGLGGVDANAQNDALRRSVELLEQTKKKMEDEARAARDGAEAVKGQKTSVEELTKEWQNALDRLDPAGKAMREMAESAAKIKEGLSGVNWPGGQSVVESGGGGGAYGPGAGSPVSGDTLSFLKERAGGGVHVEGLNATYASLAAKAIADAEAATGAKASLNSAYRDPDSPETQALWEKSGHGTKFTMADPHNSAHGVGAAMDLNSGPVLDWLHANIGKYPGLEFLPASLNDPGHLQFAGGRAGMMAESDRSRMALGDVQNQQARYNDRLAGGSLPDKAALENLQQIAKGQGDDIARQRAVLKAAEDDAEAYAKGSDARAAKDAAVAQAKIDLQDKINALKESELRLDVEKQKTAEDPEAVHKAAVALADFRMKVAQERHGKDSPEANAAQGERDTADSAYTQQKGRMALGDLGDRLKQVHEAAQEERKTIDDLYSHNKTKVDEHQAALADNARREEAAVRAVYEKELAVEGLSAEKKKAIERQLAEEIRQLRTQGADDARRTANDREASAQAIAREEAQFELRTARDKAQEERKANDDALSHQRASAQQWLAEAQRIDREEAAAIQAAHDKEIAAANLTAEERLRIEHKTQEDLGRLRNQATDDQRRAAAAQAQAMQGYADMIFGPVNSALRSAMSGHADLRQIAIRAAEDAGMKALVEIEKQVVAHLFGEAQKTGATIAGETARTTAVVAAGGAGIAAKKALDMTAMSGDAGRAAAGAYAATSEIPVIGPILAPVAAAAAFAGTMAFASADIGMWQVPNDQLAMIHRNELVATPAQADAIRSIPDALAAGGEGGGRGGAGGGNITVTNHIHTMDGASFGSFLKSNPKPLIDAIKHGVRQGHQL